VSTDPEFAPHLYRGTAELYDRYRLPYSDQLITQLLDDVRPTGRGRALDLGCGTGQLAFAIAGAFTEVLATDQESDMIDIVRSKIAAGAAHNVRPTVAGAAELDVPAGMFELITIGNAFHRMPRRQVGERVAEWLTAAGQLALCWSSSPWSGGEPWQAAFGELLADWQRRLDAEGRIPPTWSDNRAAHPDEEVLAAAGLIRTGGYQVFQSHRWTATELAGFVYATSFLPITIFGNRTAEFEAEVDELLRRSTGNTVVTDQVNYSYDLFSRPGPAGT
jgi:SAM-dependent methyltransferase